MGARRCFGSGGSISEPSASWQASSGSRRLEVHTSPSASGNWSWMALAQGGRLQAARISVAGVGPRNLGGLPCRRRTRHVRQAGVASTAPARWAGGEQQIGDEDTVSRTIWVAELTRLRTSRPVTNASMWCWSCARRVSISRRVAGNRWRRRVRYTISMVPSLACGEAEPAAKRGLWVRAAITYKNRLWSRCGGRRSHTRSHPGTHSGFSRLGRHSVTHLFPAGSLSTSSSSRS